MPDFLARLKAAQDHARSAPIARGSRDAIFGQAADEILIALEERERMAKVVEAARQLRLAQAGHWKSMDLEDTNEALVQAEQRFWNALAALDAEVKG